MPTVAELTRHPDFLAFCAAWEAAGECPPPLADWLRDRGWDSPADAATRFAELTPRKVSASLWVLDDPPADVKLPHSVREVDSGVGPPSFARVYSFPSFAEAAARLLLAGDAP